VNQFWLDLRDAMMAWGQDFSMVQVYQDALPIGPNPESNIEQRIVEDLAAKNSENHKLLKWMIQAGARLIGTEDPSLLVEEYELAQKLLLFYKNDQSGGQFGFGQHCDRQKEVLSKRDAFIAKRIDETLLCDHQGVVFLGMAHRLECCLADDIEVSYPFGKPVLDRVDSV
jgi:hypothetical protein